MTTAHRSNRSHNGSRRYALRLPPLLLLLMLSTGAQAQYDYTVDNGEVTIIRYVGPGGAVTIPDRIDDLQVTKIGGSAFYNNTTLTSVTIPGSVTDIGTSAFLGCRSLTSVTLPDSVSSIGESAFYRCYSLTSVTIPKHVSTIGPAAFYACDGVTNYSVNTLNSWYSSEFGVLFNRNQTALIQYPQSAAGSYVIPNTVKSVEQAAFSRCRNLTGITIGNAVTNIGAWAFEDCTALTSVVIPESVNRILFRTFAGCTNLTIVEIGNDVRSIEEAAFRDCTALPNITLPSSITSIAEGVFIGCLALTNITVDLLNPHFRDADGVLLDKEQRRLIQYPPARVGSYAIPDGVTEIDTLAFYRSTGLTSVTLPNSVTGLARGAFSSCTGLTNITLGNGIVYIGGSAFYGCTGLKSIILPNSLTSIGETAFSTCTGLTSITLPSGLSSIRRWTFEHCTGLSNIIVGSQVAYIEDLAFQGCYNLTAVCFEGNAPFLGSSVFAYDDNTTIYYLPGMGWGPTYGGRPTALWKPVVKSSDTTFGVQENHFGFSVTWARDKAVFVEACVDLANRAWAVVGTNTLTGGTGYFCDPQWTNYSARFYRLRWP